VHVGAEHLSIVVDGSEQSDALQDRFEACVDHGDRLCR
jgi:hypothetical protein